MVHERLQAAGLDDICLELHSQAASKRLVAERLDHTLQAAACLPETDETARHLTAARDRLNQVSKCLHAEIGDTAMTPYQALSIQIAAAARGFIPDARLVEEAAHWTGKEFAENARLVERLAGLTESGGPLNSHLYFGVRRIALQPADFQRQIPRLQALADKAASLAGYATMIANYFGLSPDASLAGVKTLIAIFKTVTNLPRGSENIAAAIAMSPSPRRIAEAAALGAKWKQLNTFHPAAWTAPVAKLRAPIAKGVAFWHARAGKAYREAGRSLASLLSMPLPKRPADRLALVDALLARPGVAGQTCRRGRVPGELARRCLAGKKDCFPLDQ